MNKLVVAFMLAFVFFAVLAGIMEGAGGIHVTQLTAQLSAAGPTASVNSTMGFLNADYFVIGDEEIAYSGKTATTFTGLTRGFNGSTPVLHASTSKLYSAEANVVNAALGYNIVSTGATPGDFNFLTFGWRFVRYTVPRLVTWDFNFLKTSDMFLVRVILMCISAGFLISFSLFLWQAAGGLLSTVWHR